MLLPEIKRVANRKVKEVHRQQAHFNSLDLKVNQSAMQDADVIACTTTGAAKHKNLISGIQSQILIIEEAGQINEVHVATALNSSTQ